MSSRFYNTTSGHEPLYLSLHHRGELKYRVEQAREQMKICSVCAWKCPVNRLSGQLGVCRTGVKARVASFGPHHGEENPLRGWRGSGTIFFSRCNLRCQYCQNHDISQTNAGEEVTSVELANIMLHLQEIGCHNINLVSPSHVVPQFLEALYVAVQKGLHIPIVYNTGGYDSQETLKTLDGIIDIYMPDMKYADPLTAKLYSKAKNYPQVNREAVLEMHRQVGDLIIDENGIARRGLLIRHLVLPNNLAGTEQILSFIATKISKNTYLNIMDQYRPLFRAYKYPLLNRPISHQEYQEAVQIAKKLGLNRLDRRIPIYIRW